MSEAASSRALHFLKKGLRLLLLGFLLWLLLHSFFFQTVRIPSASMHSTYKEGDYVLVNKLAAGARLPITPLSLPASGDRWFLDWIQLPYLRLPGYSGIQRNDVLVFNYPVEDHLPVDQRQLYIKRCVALPGDTLQLVAGIVHVNGKKQETPEGIILPARIADTSAYTPLIFPNYPPVRWNTDHFGPVRIPRAGDSVRLERKTLPLYTRIIEKYEGHTLKLRNDSIFIDGKPARHYVFEMDYYFMLGDNRPASRDSRYWGFLPEDHVIGRASFSW